MPSLTVCIHPLDHLKDVLFLLYILYTNNCQSRFGNWHTLIFAGDCHSRLLSVKELNHWPVLDYFIAWSKESYLELNVLKTKEMVIDFRNETHTPALTDIDGSRIELVDT